MATDPLTNLYRTHQKATEEELSTALDHIGALCVELEIAAPSHVDKPCPTLAAARTFYNTHRPPKGE